MGKRPPSSVVRIKSAEKKPATDKCNARLTKRDGYCKRAAGHGTDHLGVGRCKFHGGLAYGNPNHMHAKDVYMMPLTLEKREKLQSFLKDATKLDNEVGLMKLSLQEAYQKFTVAEKEFDKFESTPLPDSEFELKNYERKRKILGDRVKERQEVVLRLFDKVTKATETNSKITHGKIYTLNITQVNELIINQMSIMKEFCSDCPKLATVAKKMKEIKIRGTGNLAKIARDFHVKQKESRDAIEEAEVVE